MIIINSAAYVTPEFRAEFGSVPPCLLPIGNRKLVEYQVPLLRRIYDEKIIVSLPFGYELTIDEQRLFLELDVEVSYVPVSFTLAEALLYVLNTVGVPGEPLRLLHGDTLLDELPKGLDLIGVATTEDDYSWETEMLSTGLKVVWCGYFAFSSIQLFVRSLALAQGDFVKAVRLYSSEIRLSIVEVNGWHDLGHVNTYFVSRSRITTQRVFNSLCIKDGVVRKSGLPQQKILAECSWFKKLPVSLRRYVPQLIDGGIDSESGNAYYMLEYLACSPLNEVFVHGRNPDFFWRRIFNLIGNFLSDARDCFDAGENDLELELEAHSDALELYKTKTYARLEEYAVNNGLDLDSPASYADRLLPSIRKIAEDCISRTLSLPVIPAVLHGDFCFSNILFDSRGGVIKVVDPRGLNQKNEIALFGDQKYDLAKLSHSVMGLYDFIIAGRYRIQRSGGADVIRFSLDERVLNIQKTFLATQLLPGVGVQAIMPLTVLLFLSMLPLHNDRPERQQAMLINAIRLYVEYVV